MVPARALPFEGETPAPWVKEISRKRAAPQRRSFGIRWHRHRRRLLEKTDLPLKEVAARSGVPISEGLRRLFLRRLEIGPQEYRLRFRSEHAGARMARDVVRP